MAADHQKEEEFKKLIWQDNRPRLKYQENFGEPLFGPDKSS